jgi:hypothetical protein
MSGLFSRWTFSSLGVILAIILPSLASASCLIEHAKVHTTRTDDTRLSLSPSGFFGLTWEPTGESAFDSSFVEPVLLALDSARVTYLGLPGSWDIPLGGRPYYPVEVSRLNMPGATSLPQDGLTAMFLDHDPAQFSDDPVELLEVTCAHELFHAFQLAQSFDLRDLAFLEATAVWAEDFVYPTHRDWVERYLPAWLASIESPLDETDGTREYGSAMLVKYLLERNGSLVPVFETFANLDEPGHAWDFFLESLAIDETAVRLECLFELILLGAGSTQATLENDLVGLNPEDFIPLWEQPEIDPHLASIPSLSCRLARCSSSGRIDLQQGAAALWIALPDGLAEVLGEENELVVRAGDVLIMVAPDPDTSPGLLLFEKLSNDQGPGYLVWPNPGGSNRHIQFDRAPFDLVVHDLLGRQLAIIPTSQGGLQQSILLPPSSTGLLILSRDHGQDALPLFMR